MKIIKGLLLMLSFSLIAVAGVKANSTNQIIEDNIFEAIKSIDYTSINVLLSDGTDIDTVDQEGNTPLMVAAKVGNPRILDIILSHNPSLNMQNNSGATALIIAAKTGQLHIVKELVSRGADTSIRDNQGRTALKLASKFGHEQVVEFLDQLPKQHILAK